MNFDELGALLLCVDSYEDEALKGRLYSSLSEDMIEFNGVTSLLKKIDTIFENEGLPRATTRFRSFGRSEQPAHKKSKAPKNMTGVTCRGLKGKLATFSLRVLYRQNATWQGIVSWLERDEEENFRSVLELIMLIDSALKDE